jgi:hypothetical protein
MTITEYGGGAQHCWILCVALAEPAGGTATVLPLP